MAAQATLVELGAPTKSVTTAITATQVTSAMQTMTEICATPYGSSNTYDDIDIIVTSDPASPATIATPVTLATPATITTPATLGTPAILATPAAIATPATPATIRHQ